MFYTFSEFAAFARLQAVVVSPGQTQEFTAAPAAGGADAVDLLRADLVDEANSFQEVRERMMS